MFRSEPPTTGAHNDLYRTPRASSPDDPATRSIMIANLHKLNLLLTTIEQRSLNSSRTTITYAEIGKAQVNPGLPIAADPDIETSPQSHVGTVSEYGTNVPSGLTSASSHHGALLRCCVYGHRSCN
ncbi:unnamed protein product [Peniophora sp. CBMAI 1063]|nr:unnamed protein product [Peniophora sp. CBMAI 1063]